MPGKLGCSQSQKACVNAKYDEFDYFNECSVECPLECTTSSYDITAQSISYITSTEKIASFREILSRKYNLVNMSDEEVGKRVLSLYVFYEDLKFTQITQIAKTTSTDLVSKVGGTLGLFLGLSLLSFIEIFELLLEILFLSCTFDRKTEK